MSEIVERLKAEGQLTRNTGTNSIRAVRIQLAKFEGIFETISEQVTLQTKLLADMVETSMDQLRINAETGEREKARQQRKDLADAQEEDRDEPADVSPARAEREGPGLFSMLSGMGIGKLLIGGALLGAGLFAAYNIAKGFIDEKTGGKFSDFERGLMNAVQNIDFEEIKKLFNGLKDSLKTIADLINSFASTMQSIIDNPLLLFGGATAGGFALGRGIAAFTGPRAGPTTERADLKTRLGAVRGNILTAVALLTLAFGDEAKQFLEEQAGVPPEWADPAVDTASMAIYGATLGSMFGPTGMLVGAAAGLAVGLGFSIYNWLDRKKAEAAEQLKRDLAEADTILKDEGKRAEIQSIVDVLKTMTPEEQSAFIKKRGGLTRPEQLAFEQVATPEDYDTEAITYHLGEIRRAAQMGSMVQAVDVNALRNLGYDLNNLQQDTGYALPEYKRGTKGFQDFGPASFAILHGREAVVPEETPAGRFLSQFFNEDFSPKMSRANLAEEVSTAASGSVNMPIIINNSPTVAPVINNVHGGPNVSSTTIFGSGGGDRSRNTYGIPSSAN